MAELKQLKRTAANIKAQLTRFNNFLETLDEQLDQTQITIQQVECRLSTIEPLLQSFGDVQESIEHQEENVDDEDINIHRLQFENKYFQCIAKAKYFINKFTVKNAILLQQLNQQQISNLNPNSFNIKLPTINLPQFNGFYEDWSEFYDTFSSLIHSNASLNEIQKFHYLRSSLKGDASHVISALEVSASNYDVAWQILRERYENKKLIINKHVKALFNLAAISKESHSALRRLLDDTSKHIRALEALGQPVQHWSALIIYILTSKFDPTTRREWESFDSSQDVATFEIIKKFLQRRCDILEALVPNLQTTPQNQFKRLNTQATFHAASPSPCAVCKGPHSIFNCESFLKLSISNRVSEVKRLKLCINCLRANHVLRDCKSKLCRLCNKHHNTILHIDSTPDNEASPSAVVRDISSQVEQVSLASQTFVRNRQPDQVLLPTASVHVADADGRFHVCRALLDSGSQANFITDDMCRRLGLTISSLDSVIYGINGLKSNISHKTEIKMHSIHTGFKTDICCLIVPKISDRIPLISFDASTLNIPEHLHLADKTFNEDQTIDILIGSAVFWELLCVGQIKLGNSKLILQETHLGWVVAGPLFTKQPSNSTMSYFVRESCDTLEEQVTKFWTIEECSTNKRSIEEQEVEDHFVATTKRNSTGRLVSVSKRNNIDDLGDSRNTALKRFFSIEKKLATKPELRTEYEDIKHMTKICEDNRNHNISYYLPHHPVIKEISTATKVGVVFDGSCKTSTNLSLYDIQKNSIANTDIEHDFYVDNFISDSDSMKEAKQKYREVSDILRNAGFVLWKWMLNEPDIFEELTTHAKDDIHQFCKENLITTLGIIWKPKENILMHAVRDNIGKCEVALLKNTLPRSELCAVILLAHLAYKVRYAMTVQFNSFIYWSDLTITFTWIKDPSIKWTTFAGNRAAGIQSLINAHDWYRTNTKENPADFLSRGTTPKQLCNANLWWHFPPFLSKDSSTWPIPCEIIIKENISEMRNDIITFAVPHKDLDIFTRYSTLMKLQRVLSYAFKFVNNSNLSKDNRTISSLTVSEVDNDLFKNIKLAQDETISNEIMYMKNKKALPRKSKPLCLNPFSDSSGILRVGGLWKVGVKSDKSHLIRVVGNAHLNYEEFNMVLVQIEAILISRPLYPLTIDYYDLTPLTSAYFPIDRTLISTPNPTVLHIPENRLSIYQCIQNLSQHFWKRWIREYITQLQVRCKWQSSFQSLLQSGAMVLLKEDNLPPLQWQLGRIT